MVCRDERGDFVAAMLAKHAGISFPLMAKMMAARAAVLFARDLQAESVELEGDAHVFLVVMQ